MQNVRLFVLSLLIFAVCTKCGKPGTVCTDEFRMVTLKVVSATSSPIALDSVFTIRQSTGERIQLQQPGIPGYYVVLDDSYQSRLRKSADDFRFVGWRNNGMVVNQIYNISGDNCHISKRSGVDSVIIQ